MPAATAKSASVHDGMRAGFASARTGSRASSSIRSATSISPKPATQIGTYGACGTIVASRNTPSQRICAADSGSRDGAPEARTERGRTLMRSLPGASRARSARSRRCSRPWPAGSARPGTCSANGRADALRREHPRGEARDPLVAVERPGQGTPGELGRSAAAAALEVLRIPAGPACDRFPRDPLREDPRAGSRAGPTRSASPSDDSLCASSPSRPGGSGGASASGAG